MSVKVMFPSHRHGSNLPTGQQQWQQQQATLNDHRRAELQDLSRRMHKLNVQMDDLTASLRGPGMPHSAPDPFTQATFAKNPSAHSAQPMESHHPGPCPFPAEPENSRFVEIDEPADQEGHNASFPHVHRQGQDSPHSSADQFSQAHLEQLLQEGSQARVRSASVGYLCFAGASFLTCPSFSACIRVDERRIWTRPRSALWIIQSAVWYGTSS